MLEIFLVAWLCKSLGNVLRAKGRKPLVFQIALGISWFVGEVGGGIVGGIVAAIRNGGVEAEGFDFTIYLCALAGAALAAGFWFAIAYAMPGVQPAWVNPAGNSGPIVGPPPTFAPPSDPNNPYAPPSADS